MPENNKAEPPSAEQLWQFSLELYPKVKNLCLQWQNELTANVNVVLLLCYLEQEQLSVNVAQLQDMTAMLTRFSDEFTVPLRSLRQRSATAALSTLQQQRLKQTLLQTELELEKLEQQLLLQHCPALTVQAAPLLELYLTQLGANDYSAGHSLTTQILDLRQACQRLKPN